MIKLQFGPSKNDRILIVFFFFLKKKLYKY